jgi:peptidyl-prolyl cis-trans isomerase C
MNTKLKTFAGALMLGSALLLGSVAALAQDAPAPAADAASAAAAPAPVTPETVLATVGGSPITEADLNYVAEDLQQQLQSVPQDQQRAFLLSVLIDMRLMAKAAKDAGLDQSADYKARLGYLEDRTLRREFFSKNISSAVTEDAVKAAYDKYVADYKPVEEVRARHILVATEEEAKAVKADLDGGKPFEVEAMAKTTDPSGKQNGGDLGFFQKGQMVPEFEQVAFSLQPGQVSDPVQSQFGWHIIKLEEKRMTAPEPFEQLAQQLGQQVIFETYDAEMKKFKAATTVEIPDAALAEQVRLQTEGGGQ